MILQNLVDKYASKPKRIHGCVYRLSYAGKHIIVKARTLEGSLVTIQKNFAVNQGINKLHYHFFEHIRQNPNGRFRVKLLSRSTRPYFLLKREQMELDKARYNQKCLNNAVDAYIPLYNEATGLYGWIPKGDVLRFKRFLRSKHRKALLDKYKNSQRLRLAKSA